MKYSGVFHLGVHKATVAAAGVGEGKRVEITIDRDDEPLPTDAVPADLATALSRVPAADASWKQLSPARRRGYVAGVIGAKQPATRARRIAKIVEELRRGVPPRRTWTPPARSGQRR
jgi:uncharacterized protein YdeI (YjbR/CyaY-like superfamily)